jgi:ATP-dependent helicase/DNAse subunit B
LLEAAFTMTLGGYKITGRIDRVDEVTTSDGVTYEVLDYKSGSGGASPLKALIEKFLPPEGAAPTDYQLPLYALALGQGVGAIKSLPRAVSYYNLEELERKSRGKFGTAACRTITFDGKTVDTKAGTVPLRALTGEITGGILETLGQMSASPYPARPDFNSCKYCAFRAACDRGRAQKGEPG